MFVALDFRPKIIYNGAMQQRKRFDLSGARIRPTERIMAKGGDLLDHPGQWKTHGAAQARGVVGLVQEFGVVSALRAYRSQRAGGQLVTWDGHLRKSLDPDFVWPVDVYTDMTDDEADVLLATIDPVAALADSDAGLANALWESLAPCNPAVTELLDEIARRIGAAELDEAPHSPPDEGLGAIPPDGVVAADAGVVMCPECGAIIPLERNL